MSQEIKRILNPEGTIAEGQQAPPISPEDLIRLYRVMLLNRRVDDRMTKLQRQGRIGFYIGSLGEEAAIIGSAFPLKPEDWIIPCYRELGAILLRGYPLFDLCCQFFGNEQDVIKGKQMPNHYASRELRFGSISSPVGTQIPHATGLGMAIKIQGKDEVVLVYFGEGATSEGDFHVAANFAGVYKSPVIFFCRNNQWAISVPFEEQTASRNIAVKAEAYGIAGSRVDGNDIFGVISVTQEAVERARSGDGPTLIEAVTYRQGAHSTSDDPQAYRSEKEVESWKQKDPLRRFKTYLIGQELWSEDQESRLEEEIKAEIQENLKKAEKIAPPPLETIVEDVFDTVPWHLQEQLHALEEAREREFVEQAH